MWRVQYAIITAIIGFMLLWRIFGLKENAHFQKRSRGEYSLPCIWQPCHPELFNMAFCSLQSVFQEALHQKKAAIRARQRRHFSHAC